MTFLYQIEANLRKKMKQRKENSGAKKKRKTSTPNADGCKTIGAKVPPDLYQRLVKVKEIYGKTSLKEALVLAAESGCDNLLQSAAKQRAMEQRKLRATSW